MKKLRILFVFTLFFCVFQKINAQDKNTIFETINLLSAFADVFKIQPQSGHPFEAFLQDTARINNNIRSLQKYFDTDTFPVVCVAVEFLSFNQFNDSTKLLSQTQFRKFLKNTPRATIGINKFFSLHRVDHDSMYQYFLSRVDPVLYFSFNQIFYDYRAKDALILSMEKKEHNFVGIGDTGIVSFADKIALMCNLIFVLTSVISFGSFCTVSRASLYE
jgi:hypothetical protein